MDNKFPEHIMIKLRGRYGLREDDQSSDGEINQLTPGQAFSEVIAWELGSPSWADTVVGWMESCGMEVKGKDE